MMTTVKPIKPHDDSKRVLAKLTHSLQRTNDPPWQQLLIMDFMGTSLGSTARICAVGASNSGFTSTKCSSLPPNGSCSSSTG
jgi:hypothetical protein